MGMPLIIIGISPALLGAILNLGSKLRLSLFPGDILVQKGNMTLYFPIVTSILLSMLLTLIWNLWKK